MHITEVVNKGPYLLKSTKIEAEAENNGMCYPNLSPKYNENSIQHNATSLEQKRLMIPLVS
jgi:hypothetical protein